MINTIQACPVGCYQTKNTLIAAALVTIGRKVLRSSRDNGSVVWSFSDGIVPPGIEADAAFKDHSYKHEPLCFIFKVASAREWIINNVIHPDRGCYETEPVEQDCFVTQNLAMASCLIAEDFYLRAFSGREFYFAPGARNIVEKFKTPPTSDSPLDWQRRYLDELGILLRKVKTC